jgi:ATP-binding cassette subfamily C protein CydC
LGDDEIRDLSESDLRRHISVATQQAHIFNTTLKENLRVANPEATDDELFAALESAQLLDFVKSLPDGLNTWIGEAGKLLSGGQARRVAVARVILHNAPVWVLDEPTEDLDPVTEEKMMQSLYERTEGRTFLLITHRLLELHRMDHIVMLERGQIVAQGHHESLLKRSSRYAVFYEKIF